MLCLLLSVLLPVVARDVREHSWSKVSARFAIGLIGVTILRTILVLSKLIIFYYVYSLTWSFTSSLDVLKELVLINMRGELDELQLSLRRD